MELKVEEEVDARQSSTEWSCVNGGDLIGFTWRMQIENVGKDHTRRKELTYGLTHPCEVLDRLQ